MEPGTDQQAGNGTASSDRDAGAEATAATLSSVAEAFRRLPRRTRIIIAAAGLALVTVPFVLGVLVGSLGSSGRDRERPPATHGTPAPARAEAGGSGAAPFGGEPSSISKGTSPPEGHSPASQPPSEAPGQTSEGIDAADASRPADASEVAGPAPGNAEAPPEGAVSAEPPAEPPAEPMTAAGDAATSPSSPPDAPPPDPADDGWEIELYRTYVKPFGDDPATSRATLLWNLVNRSDDTDLVGLESEGELDGLETDAGGGRAARDGPRRHVNWIRPDSRKGIFLQHALIPADARTMKSVSGSVVAFTATERKTLRWDDPARAVGQDRTVGGYMFTLAGYDLAGPSATVKVRCTPVSGTPRGSAPEILTRFRLYYEGGTYADNPGFVASGPVPEVRSCTFFQRDRAPTEFVVVAALGVERKRLSFSVDEEVDLRGEAPSGRTVRARVREKTEAAPSGARASRGPTVDEDALLAPLPRTERRRLSAKPRRPLTEEERADARSIIAELRKPFVFGGGAAEAKRRGSLERLAGYDHPEVSRQLNFLVRDRDSDLRDELLDVLAKHDNFESALILLRIASSGDQATSQATRKKACSALASLRDERAVEWLYTEWLLKVDAASTRALIAGILGEVGEERSVPYLIGALRDRDAEVRSQSARALGKMRAAEAASSIARLTSDPTPQVRAAALLALGSIRDRKWTKTAVRHLKDRAPLVRRAAAQACGAMRTPEVVGPLIEALRRGPRGIRGGILRALALVTGMLLDEDLAEWKLWWSRSKASFEVPPIEKVAEVVREMERAEAEYYGIRIYSKRIIFVTDISGSMLGEKLEDVKAELKKTIKEFDREHFFNMIFFNHAAHPWRTNLVQAGKQSVVPALAHVERLDASGGTNIRDPLLMALKDRYVEAIFLLTDGGAPGLDELRAEVRKANATRGVVIHCIGIGEDHDREFMEGLARENGGRYLTPGRPAE